MMRMMKTITVKTKNPSLIAMVIQKSKSIKMTTRAVRKSRSLQIKRKMRQRIS
jgi:transaldolase